MNKYGSLLQQQWTAVDPMCVSSLSDPTTYFAQMGERGDEVQELLPSPEGTDPPGRPTCRRWAR